MAFRYKEGMMTEFGGVFDKDSAAYEAMGLKKRDPCDGTAMRIFDTGATRSAELDKLDYEGFLCPFVLERYAQYLHEHKTQADGKVRESDNWQKGIPQKAYVKSLLRHVLDFWKKIRGGDYTRKAMQDLVCGILFNAMGWLHEDLKTYRNIQASMKSPLEHAEVRLGAPKREHEGCGGSGQ